ncbi:MAG TPA: hypothetical protein VJS69_07135 [Candidatus Krumholzibacteria bacterium]|nr:hypothetical protein [Candidatus Krumholzibacteria bacterium]
MHHKRPAVILAFGIVILAGVMMAANSDSDRSTYFGGQQFRVSAKPLDAASASAIIARSSQLHTLYMSDGCDPNGRQFVAVTDAIEGDSYSPLWRGVQIEFNPGYPCHQFRSENEITSAVKTGEISLNPTGYVYRCRVIGPDK